METRDRLMLACILFVQVLTLWLELYLHAR